MWLKSFQRLPHTARAEVVDCFDNAEFTKPELSLRLKMPIGGSHSATIETDFADWKSGGHVRYLQASGFAGIKNNAHDVFTFTDRGRQFFVPTLLLIQALFPNIEIIGRYLLQPSGLPQVCVPTKSEAGFDIGLMPAKLSRNKASIYRWIQYHPSAKDAWYSVYQNFRRGRCSVALPRARVVVWLKARVLGDEVFATRLKVIRIETMEQPYPWSGAQPQTVIYGDEYGVRSTIEGFSRPLPLGTNGYSMSDVEWAKVRPLFDNAKTPMPDEVRRAVIDAIIEKFAKGVSWTAVRPLIGDMTRDLLHHYRFVVRGRRWEQIETILRQHRS